jgi:hypothetical protein
MRWSPRYQNREERLNRKMRESKRQTESKMSHIWLKRFLIWAENNRGGKTIKKIIEDFFWVERYSPGEMSMKIHHARWLFLHFSSVICLLFHHVDLFITAIQCIWRYRSVWSSSLLSEFFLIIFTFLTFIIFWYRYIQYVLPRSLHVYKSLYMNLNPNFVFWIWVFPFGSSILCTNQSLFISWTTFDWLLQK